MEFINEYGATIKNLREKAENLRVENEKDDQRKAELNAEYQSAVTDTDFDSANKVKSKMKEIEAEQETREDIIEAINKKIMLGDTDAAKKAAVSFYNAKKEHAKQRDKLIKEATKKRDEYVETLSKVVDYNSFLNIGSNQIEKISSVFRRLDIQETVKELGFNPSTLAQRQPEIIDFSDFVIRDEQTVKSLSEQKPK